MQKFERSKNNRLPYANRWADLEKFYKGEQYDYKAMPKWIPKPVTNMIHLVVTTKRSALAMENPTGLLSAVAEEHVQHVDQLQRIYEWVWKKIRARDVVRQNIETATLLGTAIAHVYWDENTGVMGTGEKKYEGEIRIKELDPSTFFPDPNAKCLEECQYIHVVEKKPKAWIEKTFGVKLDKNDIDPTKDETNIYDNKELRDATSPEAMLDFHAHYEKVWNSDPEIIIVPKYEVDPATGQQVQVGEEETETGAEIGGWRYKCTYLVGDKILKVVERLEPNMYPFAVLYDYRNRTSFWGKSSAELILDDQKLINKIMQVIAINATQMQNPVKLVKKGSGIDLSMMQKYGMVPGATFPVNDNINIKDAVHVIDPPAIPQALPNMVEQVLSHIREVTGMSEAYMGQSVGSLQTSGGVNSLIDRATLRDRDKMRDIEMYVEDLSRLIIAFIVTKYTDKRWVKVINNPANPNDATFVPFIGRDFKDVEFDFYINVSAKAPISIMRRQQEAKELLNLQGQYGFAPRLITPQDYVKDADLVDGREIIARMDREEQMNQQNLIMAGLQTAVEAITQNIPPDQALQMAMQQITQIQQGNAQNPLDPQGLGSGGQPTGNASNSLNVGQMQANQAGVM